MVTLATYLISLAVVVFILVSAVLVHMHFGLHRIRTDRRQGEAKGVTSSQQTPHLHDIIFAH